MMYRPEFAPGCFGGAMTFKSDSAECQSCPFASSCGVASAERMKALRAEHGLVEAPLKQPAIARAGTAGAMTLPKKVAEEIDRLDRMGVKVTESFRAGVNPFAEKGNKALKIIAQILLLRPDGVDKNLMKLACMKRFEWTEGTAAAQVNQAIQVFCALGAARAFEDRISLTGA